MASSTPTVSPTVSPTSYSRVDPQFVEDLCNRIIADISAIRDEAKEHGKPLPFEKADHLVSMVLVLTLHHEHIDWHFVRLRKCVVISGGTLPPDDSPDLAAAVHALAAQHGITIAGNHAADVVAYIKTVQRIGLRVADWLSVDRAERELSIQSSVTTV